MILSIKVRRFLLLFIPVVILLVFGIGARIPAWQGYQWILGSPASIQAGEFSGTLWEGRAGRFLVDGYDLGEVDWVVTPSALFRGRIQADIVVAGREVNASGRLTRSLFGTGWRIENALSSAPATWLQIILQEPFLQLQGDIELDLASVSFDDAGWVESIDGRCTWRAASIGGTLSTDLGDLSVSFESNDDTILGRLFDSGGALALDGTVTVRDRHYVVDAWLDARADRVPLRQALLVLGQPGSDGRTHLGITGPLLPLSGWTQ